MKTLCKVLLSVLVVAAVLPETTQAQTRSNEKRQATNYSGIYAPDFSLPDQNNNQFQLASLKGKKVVLMFFRGYWCGYCMAQLSDFAKHKAEFDKLNVALVAISVDDHEHTRQVWKTAVKQQFPVLSDADAKVMKKYGILVDLGEDGMIAQRTLFIVDENGVQSWRRVSKSAADISKAEDILKRLQPMK